MPLADHSRCWWNWGAVFLKQEDIVTSSSSFDIASVIVANKSERALWFPIRLWYRARTVTTTALIDCGATGNFINPSFVSCLLLPSRAILPLQAFNVDGTVNKQGWITAATTIHCQATNFKDDLTLMIVDLGCAQVVLGMPWLMKHNPHIDWEKKTMTLNAKHICKATHYHHSKDQSNTPSTILRIHQCILWTNFRHPSSMTRLLLRQRNPLLHFLHFLLSIAPW